MAITQRKSRRKYTGGVINKQRKKKKMDFGSDFLPIKIGDEKRMKIVEGLSNYRKERLLQADKANVFDQTTGKAVISKILSVKENSANPNFIRMGIVTKGAVIETEAGLARVISRPGQHGIVNAVKIKEK